MAASCRAVRVSSLLNCADEFFAIMADLMNQQTKTPPSILTSKEILDLNKRIKEILSLLAASGIPDALNHLDFNPENIFVSGDRCTFIDWAEARLSGGGPGTAGSQWVERTAALAVHAYDQAETLLGQGTIGMELAEQAPVDTVLVPVGGGGLIGGIAAWYAGAVKVVGVEPESAPTLSEALKAGRPVDAPAGGIAADSLAPRRVGELMFPIAQAHVARVALVSDAAIRRAQDALWSAVRIVAEPGGAAALAALLGGAYVPAVGERVAVLVSGGNSTAVDFGPG